MFKRKEQLSLQSIKNISFNCPITKSIQLNYQYSPVTTSNMLKQLKSTLFKDNYNFKKSQSVTKALKQIKFDFKENCNMISNLKDNKRLTNSHSKNHGNINLAKNNSSKEIGINKKDIRSDMIFSFNPSVSPALSSSDLNQKQQKQLTGKTQQNRSVSKDQYRQLDTKKNSVFQKLVGVDALIENVRGNSMSTSLGSSSVTLKNGKYDNSRLKFMNTEHVFYQSKQNQLRQRLKSSQRAYGKFISKNTNASICSSVITHSSEQNIRVNIRFKPDLKRQSDSKQSDTNLTSPSSETAHTQPQIKLLNQQVLLAMDKIFAFDRLFYQQDQCQIFESVAKPIIQKVFQGYNGTIFAYGQTGSGKTHTIFGNIQNGSQSAGLIPRSIRQIFTLKNNHESQQTSSSESFNSIDVSCSLVEIYKQQLFDMFIFNAINKPELKLKQNKTNGVYVENLTELQAQSEGQIMLIIEEALKSRKISSTKLNEKSSRSHTILTLGLKFNRGTSSEFKTQFSLIDLAGSQKVRKSGVTGESLEQTKKINYSLSCLGNVINALTTRSNTDHIPFRDSKLTRILKNSLSGRFLTSIIVTCSLGRQCYNQTLSSLKFAERAKRVRVSAENQMQLSKYKNSKQSTNRISDSIEYYQQKITELKKELLFTKNELQIYKMRQSYQFPQASDNSYYQSNFISPLASPHNTQINFAKQQDYQQTIRQMEEELQETKRILSANKLIINESGTSQKYFQNCSQNSNNLQSNRSPRYQNDDLTARLPIPSQRACVAQQITKYTDKQITCLSLVSKIQPFSQKQHLKQHQQQQDKQNKPKGKKIIRISQPNSTLACKQLNQNRNRLAFLQNQTVVVCNNLPSNSVSSHPQDNIQFSQIDQQEQNHNYKENNNMRNELDLCEESDLQITESKRYTRNEKGKSCQMEQKQSQISFSFSVYRDEEDVSQRKHSNCNSKITTKRSVR